MRNFPFPAFAVRLLLALTLVWAGHLHAAGTPESEAAAKAAEDPSEKLAWKAGPTKGDLKDRAQLEVPPGFRFLDAKDASKLLVMAGNRSNGRELGLVENIEGGWWVIFEFDEVGYVKDDEKDKLDADKLLASIRKGNEAGNEYRKEQGQPPISIVGWHVKPNFNDQTKNLEWSILGESRGRQFVNYNVRVLGRHGVTEVTLVDDVESVDKSLPGFREMLKQFNYKSGESYAEFKQGDKIAQYGLGALVLGGAAAVGYKLGFFATILAFFKKFAKIVIFGLIAVAVAVRKFFSNLFQGRRRDDDSTPT
jgi:uncharacterized membrane-anchored protein